MITLITSIRDAVKASDDIKNWCVLTYGREHTVYTGIDPRKPPGESEYPLVAIFPDSKIVGHDISRKGHSVGIVCGVYDDTMSSLLQDGVEPTGYVGVTNLETFRKLVETATLSELSGTLVVDRLEIQYETVESFPFLLASMLWTITEEIFIGDDLFE